MATVQRVGVGDCIQLPPSTPCTQPPLTPRTPGVTQSFGYKHGEVDTIIPEFMGVPKPILEYVIFCHQVCVQFIPDQLYVHVCVLKRASAGWGKAHEGWRSCSTGLVCQRTSRHTVCG